jgi:plastocyanin
LTNLAYPGGEGAVAWSLTEVELTLDDILAAPHSIVVHESEENISNYVLCGDLTGEPGMDGALAVSLMELNGSGMAGVASLMPSEAGTSISTIALEDGAVAGMMHHEGDVAHPAHIHAGDCDAPGEVVFPLTDFTVNGSTESSRTELEASLDDILAAPHSIVAHMSSDDMGTYIVCGDITGEPTDGILAITLNELNDSGHVGVAVLGNEGMGATVQAYLIQGAGGSMMGDGSPEAEMGDHDMAATDGVEIDASINGFQFLPGEIEIKVGTTITWTNEDSAPHTVTANDRSFNSGRLEQGQTFSFTFDTAGEFEYFCEYHPGMAAVVVVTE